MMGIKEREFRPLPDNLSLEELVPKDNFYRCLEGRIDLSFLRGLVVDRYATVGRASIDPVFFFRLQLVMFFEGIRSERQLMEIASDRLSIRWYLGYDLHPSKTPLLSWDVRTGAMGHDRASCTNNSLSPRWNANPV